MSYKLVGYLQAFSSAISLVLNIFFQVGICRCLTEASLLKSVFAGFFIGLFSLWLFEFYCLSRLALPLIDALFYFLSANIIYIALGYIYFHFINLGETARRVRILRELNGAPYGLSLEQILMRYNAEEIFKRRLQRLINSGQAVIRGNKYFIGNSVMLWMARIVIAMKLLVIGKRSEFN